MPSSSEISVYLNLAVATAQQAAGRLSFPEDQRVLADLERDVKIGADRKLHMFITEQLSKESPFPVYSEEAQEKTGPSRIQGPFWIVDPLDGSLNYSRQIPLYGISIALWQDQAPLSGIVYDFNKSEMFSAIPGHGAWLNGQPICVGNVREKSQAVLCTGFPVGTDFTEEGLTQFVHKIRIYKKVRLFGSAALSLAYVASGRADMYQENDIALWDVAAGLALVVGAGGKIDFQPGQKSALLRVRAGNAFLV
ncbi:MAG: inositol monophosphatase [Deltaproteobacteria bacterium]|nr:inositol monophosphatase [Deltaproteobacteria bacterium]